MKTNTIQYGDIIILVSPKGKRYTKKLLERTPFHTADGVILSEDILTSGFASFVRTQKNIPYLIQRPNIYDILFALKRKTQIIYPKDIAYICLRLGIGQNTRVLEAGSGSGGLTTALSHFSGTEGHVYTYEAREEFFATTKENLEWAGLGKNVTQYHRDISEGVHEKDIDSVFLDVRTPWEYLDIILDAIIAGGHFAFLLPTVNQVSELLTAMETRPFVDIEVEEVLIRKWKAVPDRLRPFDRMVAHTSFLVFARHQADSTVWEKAQPKGTREQKQMKAKEARRKAQNIDSDDTDDYTDIDTI